MLPFSYCSGLAAVALADGGFSPADDVDGGVVVAECGDGLSAYG